jgi:DNA polymerase II large subunit
MIKIRCKNCNTELESHPIRTKCCGCDNLTTLKGETITALDLTLVELLSNMSKKETKKILSNEDLAFQESRKNRKVRKLEFEIK